MVEISVIIPVYNSEKYLRGCLDSVISQSFNDIEIICVNDGSTDGSLSILESYQKQDSRIKIIQEENKGAGAARNLGIANATGKYTYFMDSDDYLEEDAFSKLIDVTYKNPSDFIMFKIWNFYEETQEFIDDDYYSMPYLKNRVGENTFSYSDVSDMALKLSVCPPGNLFKTEFIKDIKFPEGLLFEDNVFFTHALFKAENVYFYDEFLYYRRKRKDSTTAPVTVRSLDTIEITDLLLDLCDEFNHPNHKKELYYRIFNNIYKIFKKADSSQKELFFKKIKDDYIKHKAKWENDDYFTNNLNPKYRHMFNCAIKSKNARKFESCVDNYSKESRFKKLRKKLL